MAYKNTNEYISSFSKEKKEILEKIRKLIKKNIPNAEEAMIYGVPGFKLYKKNLIVYAAFKEHIGIYPEPNAIKKFKDKLSNYETSKGAIRFPLDKKIPYGLIKEIIIFRAKEIENKN